MNEQMKQLNTSDSFEKILYYLLAISPDPIIYMGKEIQPRPLYVSSDLLRDFTCPPDCGACCSVLCPSLDYLPDEQQKAPNVRQRLIMIGDGKPIYTNFQESTKENCCSYLDQKNGRCSIYLQRPFPCDFELVKFIRYEDHFRLSQQKFGRGWNLKRVTGERGAVCELFYSNHGVEEVIRKLNRLRDWAVYFNVNPLRIDIILDNLSMLKSGKPIIFERQNKKPLL